MDLYKNVVTVTQIQQGLHMFSYMESGAGLHLSVQHIYECHLWDTVYNIKI